MKKEIKGQKAPEGFVFVNEGSLEELADNIKNISNAVKKFSGPGKLNRAALVTLIKEATRYQPGNIVQEKEVAKVLTALSELEKRFIQPKTST